MAAGTLSVFSLHFQNKQKMSDKQRYKGRFIKKKVFAKKTTVGAFLTAARKRSREEIEAENEEAFSCEGRRIVELSVLGKNLRCCNCREVLSLENIVKETRIGLNSNLTVRCVSCGIKTLVLTGKIHKTKDNVRHSDINTKAVFGAVHAGFGATGLNKLLACLNIPTITDHLFKRYEREIGPAIEEAAKDSCKRAAEEERRLVLENIEKLCHEMPAEIVKEIYPHLTDLQSVANPSQILNEDGTMEMNPAISETPKTFDSALGSIIVSYDMGWSKRGNGRSYDSLNGYGAIIGFLSGKILDYSSRNRKCKRCDAGREKEDHACRKNFQGSVKAMEPDVGAELVNRSAILKEVGVNVRVVIGDEDSSTIAAIRRENCNRIFKLADTNHLRKHFVNELYEFQKMFKEMKSKEVIPHIKKCFGYAVAQNKGKATELAKCLRSLPDHLFGRHENCADWCSRNGINSTAQKILLKNEDLYIALVNLFEKYANNASKFSVAASSQANESFNNIMAHKAPKSRCYSRSESADVRLASAVCTKNDREKYVSVVHEKIAISPGKHTASYVGMQHLKHLRRTADAKLPSTKNRRNVLAQERQLLKKKSERIEGIQYQSNCGLENDIDNPENNPDEGIRGDDIHNYSVPLDDVKLVFFDIETSGLNKSADILQIAAKYENYTFSAYANPTQPIAPAATLVTGLRNITGDLYLNNKRVQSTPLKEVLQAFKEWLTALGQPCILVAHNAKFDAPHLLRAFKFYSVVDDFKKHIYGFADTLVILKKLYPERKGTGMFKLSKLAEDLLQVQSSESFHEASYDVEILEKIASKISKDYIIANTKSFMESLVHESRLQKTAVLRRSLDAMKGVISEGMITKIASAGIDREKLDVIYNEKGRAGVLELLTAVQSGGKPLVTKSKKILDKIFVFLSSNQNSEV